MELFDIKRLKEICEDKIGEYCSYPEEPFYQAVGEYFGYEDYGEANKNHDIREVLFEDTGDKHRWSYGMQAVYEIDGEYLSFYWQNPATEGQEGQPTDMTVEVVQRKTETIERVYYE